MVPILYIGFQLWRKEKTLPPSEIDFFLGSRDIEEEEEVPAKNFLEKVWRVVM